MIRITRTALELFGLSIHWYGVLIALGVGLAVALAVAREKRVGVPPETTLNLALICIPVALIGSRLYFVAFSWQDYAANPMEIFKIWKGGMAIYGGILAGVFTGWVYSRVRHESFLKLADLAAPCIPLGQAIGRWGNFVNQEAHGILVENAELRFFPVSVQIGGDWFYATFFYESMWCFCIVALLLVLEKKRYLRREGDLFLIYVFLYALERAVVEGMRTDSLYFGAFRVSQILSLLVALVVAVYWAVRCVRATKALRVLAPLSVLAALGVTAQQNNGLTFVFAVISLALTATMFIYDKPKT